MGRRMEEQTNTYYAEYLGGHSMYADRRNVWLSVGPDEVFIDELQLQIPYSIIKEVKNVRQSQVKAFRVAAFGIAGALWKKQETYLCIVFNDGIQDQSPVFKVDKLDKAQRDIYQHVVKTKLPPSWADPQVVNQQVAKKKNKNFGHASCGKCAFFGRPALCKSHEKDRRTDPCSVYQPKE